VIKVERWTLLTNNLNVFYWIIITVFSVLFTFLIYLNFDVIISNWFTSITTLIGLLGAAVTLKDVSRRFQHFLYRSKVILLNRQIALSLTASFAERDITKEMFIKIKEQLKEIGNQNTIFFENAYELSISIDGFTLQCSFRQNFDPNESEEFGEVIFFVPEYHAPYVQASSLLSNRLLPILTHIKETLGKSNESFQFDVTFKDNNPFLGLYIKDLPKNQGYSFLCSFYEKPSVMGIEEKNLIKISTNNLSVHTKNLFSLNQLIKRYLYLSGGQ
jgi:hypothetical protein